MSSLTSNDGIKVKTDVPAFHELSTSSEGQLRVGTANNANKHKNHNEVAIAPADDEALESTYIADHSSNEKDIKENETGSNTSREEINPDIAKLQGEIESLKSGKLNDPILIKNFKNEPQATDFTAAASSSPVSSSNLAKIKRVERNNESSPGVCSLPLENIQSNSDKLSSVEITKIPSFGHADDIFSSSTSPTYKGKKYLPGVSPVLDSHKYFSESSELESDSIGDQYHFTPTTGIHGNTSKVVATQHRRRTWDWSILPKVGSSVLAQIHSFNIISVPIDGEIKQILYTPNYNKNFITMNIFLSFNMDTSPKDALIHSRKRLISFGNYITHYLKSRMYAYQCYPFFLQGLSEEDMKAKNYISFNASHDYTEIETIISLWHLQAQRLYSQTNSIFFSSEVVQQLLQRKSNTRHQSALQNAVFVQQTGTSNVGAKPVITDSIEEIDILLLRPLFDSQLGWQLAYDEPNLNIADYPLDTSPWDINEQNADNILGVHNGNAGSATIRIVSNEDELEQLNSKNAGDVLYDCMERKIGDLGDDFTSSATRKIPNSTEEINDKESSPADGSKKKTINPKPAKRSGLANLFKRKHVHSISQPAAQDSAETHTPDTKHSGRTQPIQNAWLEDYFSRSLGNYKRIGLPTQYFLPDEASATKLEKATGDEKSEARKAFLYSKESLQIRLPFADNSIPSIYAPSIWTYLSYNKWRPLLREMYRCIIPGGYALGTVYDLKISNTFASATEDTMQEFPSTLERDRTFDAISLEALNKGLYIFPTQHLSQAFKDVGFTNIKYSLLSLKSGDFLTDMGCLNELFSEVIWDLLLRKEIPDPNKPPKDTDPTTLIQRYMREHMGKIDENAGCLRTLLMVAQKPRKIASE